MLNSILGTSSFQQSASDSIEDRHRETALYHANLLQERRDVEAQILQSTEELLDFPVSTVDPAVPTGEEAAKVATSLRIFQPADYEDLIRERNINGQCGYVLCSQPSRPQQTQASYRIVHGRRRSDTFNIVERVCQEKWCSDDCGRRALYIKIQLDEEPAWTRSSSTAKQDLVLMREVKIQAEARPADSSLIQTIEDPHTSRKEIQNAANQKTLAVERGVGYASARHFDFGEIVENAASGIPRKFQPPCMQLDHESIEGHQPSFNGNSVRSKSIMKGELDIMDMI